MGRFHHSKKSHSEGMRKNNNKFTISKKGNKKLENDFVYTQKHNNIWNSFCNFLDERFVEEDLSRHHRRSRVGYNDQPTQRRRDTAGTWSTTGTVKRNKDQDLRTDTSPLLTSTHAEQSSKASDSLLPGYRNGITIAYQMKNPRSYRLRRVSCVSATLTDQAVQSRYLYDPDKDDRDLHFDQMIYEQQQRRSAWAPRPYSLAEIIYEYDTEDEGRRGCQRDSDDHFHENHSHPLHQYLAYLDEAYRE